MSKGQLLLALQYTECQVSLHKVVPLFFLLKKVHVAN